MAVLLVLCAFAPQGNAQRRQDEPTGRPTAAPTVATAAPTAAPTTKAPTAAPTTPFNWTQCRSEGGEKNCALCNDVTGGALPCSNITGYSSCSDDDIVSTRKFYLRGEDPYDTATSGKGRCISLTSGYSLNSVASTAKKFPGFANQGVLVVTKANIAHPHHTDERVGVVLFKRVLVHNCTGTTSACQSGTTVADVYKLGVCVRCTNITFPFKSQVYATDVHRTDFVQNCLPEAINSTGHVKDAFQCSPFDMEYAKMTIMAF